MSSPLTHPTAFSNEGEGKLLSSPKIASAFFIYRAPKPLFMT
jgi:hypothetical protein